MALGIGVEGHKAFLRKMGQLDAPRHRAARERAADRAVALGRAQHHHDRLRPRHRGRAAAGADGGRRARQRRHHDQADLPQALRGGGARGRRPDASSPRPARRCATSCASTPTKGSASAAAIAGFFVGGKTGTAEKVVHGRYSKTKNLNDLHGRRTRMDKPKYVFLTILDEPQAVEGTHGFSTAGWNAGADDRQRHRARRAAARACRRASSRRRRRSR